MYERILVALTGDEADGAFLDHVRRLAAPTGAHVTLLRIVGVADDEGGGLGQQFQLEVGSNGWRRRNEAEAYLAWLRKATVPTLFVGDGNRQAPFTRATPRANAVMAILGSAEL